MNFLGLDWGAIGVLGGAVYATYSTVVNGQIKSAVQELKLEVLNRFGKIEQTVAVNYEKYLSLEASVRDLEKQVAQLKQDIAYRDRLHAKLPNGA